MTRLTPDMVAAIVARYAQGTSAATIATEMGVHHTTVAARLRAAGVVLRGQPRKSAAVTAEVVARYQTGEPIIAIAAAMGMSNNTVRRILIREGVPLRPAHRPRKPR
jgi:DNA-directed RNA polymerase specialized sigma24 family protein